MKNRIDIRKCSKILLDNESHYVRKNGTTYCGKPIPEDIMASNSIQIVTCNKCVNIFILRDII